MKSLVTPLPISQPTISPPRAESPSTSPSAPGHAKYLALLVFVVVLAINLALRPPLYNYDGYIYRTQALAPVESDDFSPHHLLWFPIQKALAGVLSAIGSTSPAAFQLFDIFINSLSLALLYLLLVRLSNRRAISVAAVIFIALSPRIWNLGLQNQPYPLLDLCIVGFLWAVADWESPSVVRWVASGFCIAFAVLLHQAMALAVPAVAIGFIVAGGEFKGKAAKRAAAWAGMTALGVGAVYAVIARVAGVRPAGFLGWTLQYMAEQHGLQVHWPQTAIRSVIGISDTLVDSTILRDKLDPIKDSAVIWHIYGLILAVACLVLALCLARKSVRQRLFCLVRSNASFTTVLLMTLAWSVFVFLWEPVGHFWSVLLLPAAYLATWGAKGIGRRTELVLAAALLLISAWNLRADLLHDQANRINYPPPLLAQIRAELGPNDVFIVAGRDWYANMDYDLLLACLDDWPRDPALDLLDDYVMQVSAEPWQQRLNQEIQTVFSQGGHVYVADHVFWPDTYQDIGQSASPLDDYARPEFAGVNGESLRIEIKGFFSHYQLVKSTFRVGADPYWELRPIQ